MYIIHITFILNNLYHVLQKYRFNSFCDSFTYDGIKKKPFYSCLYWVELYSNKNHLFLVVAVDFFAEWNRGRTRRKAHDQMKMKKTTHFIDFYRELFLHTGCSFYSVFSFTSQMHYTTSTLLLNFNAIYLCMFLYLHSYSFSAMDFVCGINDWAGNRSYKFVRHTNRWREESATHTSRQS